MSSPLEKSLDCIERYKVSDDPWGNRERKLYQKIFKKATELAYQHLPEFEDVDADGKIRIDLYDIGAGGGNVLDVWKENVPENVVLNIYGCDISEAAITFLEKRYADSKFDLIDLEEYDSKSAPLVNMSTADIVSIVDVMYYFSKRPYQETLDNILETLKPGAIIVVADNQVRAFQRNYYSKKDNVELLESYTDYTEPVCEEESVGENGKVRKWYRHLHVRIYKKI